MRSKVIQGTAGAIALAVSALVLSPSGLETIKQHEGLRTRAYLDSAGVPTICYGSTRNVFVPSTATLAECERRLVQDTGMAGKAIQRNVKVKLTQSQYDALVDFTFNLGETNLRNSTLLKYINAGECRKAVREFSRWVYAGPKGAKKKLGGLVKRRAKNAEDFSKGCV